MPRLARACSLLRLVSIALPVAESGLTVKSEANGSSTTGDGDERRLTISCPSGYYDASNGDVQTWACGSGRCLCGWGPCSLTDSWCNCVCQPTTTTTTSTQWLFCPEGYTQLGYIGDAVPGWGLSDVGNSASSIENCKYHCAFHSNWECAGFEYSPNYQGQGYNACRLYQVDQVKTAAQTSNVVNSITCTLKGTCHNLALPLTPADVTTVSGCNRETNFNTLRSNCLNTEWNFRIPGCMLHLTGVLIFDFYRESASASDTYEVYVDGQKVATWSQGCHPTPCIYSVPWRSTSRAMNIRSTSTDSSADFRGLVTALRFEQQALSAR